MPDWLTHVLVGLGVSNLLIYQRRDLEQFKPAIIVGSILPDLWSIRLILELIDINLAWQLYVFHTPIGAALTALLVGLVFFKKDIWKLGTFFLIAGAQLHLALDLTLHHIEGGHYILFPISWQLFELKIFWPESFTTLWLAIGFWGISFWLHKRGKVI